MKKLNEVLLSPQGEQAIVMGNWALVRAMIENNVKVVTSYPGSPTPEIGAAILGLPADENPLYFEWSINEKVATEVAFGASVNGQLSCVFFKSVGLNVAADSFVQLSHMELIGGMVIVLGDDPGANSSQNEQDNRHYAHLSYTPILEPATPHEIYTMFTQAVSLSKKYRMPIILRLTTHVCHAKQLVQFGPWIPDGQMIAEFDKKNGPYIPIAKTVFPMKQAALEKLASVEQDPIITSSNQLVDNGNKEQGIITVGLPFLSLLDVLESVDEPPDILKLGQVYPIPQSTIVDFLKAHKEVKILEELDNVLELQIKSLAYDHQLHIKIWGKRDLADWMGEYTPDKVQEALHKVWPAMVSATPADIADIVPIPPRPPQLCPGCGHRTVFHAVRRWLKDTDIAVADIGCHTLGHLPPYEVGDVLLCMGHSNGTAAGLGIGNHKRRIISFIGDSTLYHAGIPGILNAVYNNHQHTLIIMDNGTTAMTGHQDHPNTGKNSKGDTSKIPIAQLLEGLGVSDVTRVPAYQENKLIDALEQATARDGFNVIIASHPCMLKFTRESRKKGRKTPQPVYVTDECQNKNICVAEFGCPSYQIEEDGRVWVQEDLCIGDRSCIQTCPIDAIAVKQGS